MIKIPSSKFATAMIYSHCCIRNDVGWMSNFLESLKIEIAGLERKLNELRRILALYGGPEESSQSSRSDDGGLFSPRIGRPRAARSMSADTKRIMEETEAFLSGRSDPVPIREIYHEVIEIRGCRIGGSD